MAGAGRREGRSLPGLAVGDHVAADDGAGGEALFRGLPRAFPRCADAGGRAVRGRHERLGGAGILQPRAQPSCLRAGGRGAAWRAVSRHGSGVARSAGHRGLHGCGGGGHCLRSYRGSRRWQCRTGDEPAACAGGTDAGRARRCGRAHAGHRAGGQVRRFRTSPDGSRCHHLHTAKAFLCALPLAGAMPGATGRHAGELSAQGTEEGASAAARRGLRGAACRSGDPAAHASAQGPARRHGRGADQRMEREA